MALEPKWGVDVARVQALAPLVHILPDDNPAPTPVPDEVYGEPTVRPIKNQQVEEWIKAILARVEVRAWLLTKIPVDHAARAPLEEMAADVVANGAAWYTVDAAYPARAGVNDATSYGDVLRQRYEEGLESLVVAIDRILGELPAGSVVGSVATGISGSFPRPIFRDGYVR